MPARRPPIKVMMWEGDHLLGAQTLDCKRNGGLGADDAQRRRGSRTAPPRITGTPDSATHRWAAGAAAPAPRVVARAGARTK